jgi:fumarate reductase subunit C
MAPLVLLHLGVIIYATRNGLDAEEILGRTRGSLFWGLTYGLFVVAVAVHGALGVRAIAQEWLKIDGTSLRVLTWLVGLALLGLGMRALVAVTVA